jgi:hypothetical protein
MDVSRGSRQIADHYGSLLTCRTRVTMQCSLFSPEIGRPKLNKKYEDSEQRKAQHRARLHSAKKIAAARKPPPIVKTPWLTPLRKVILFPLSLLPFLALYDVYFATTPELTAPDNLAPFVLPYAVKNNSHLFDMVDTTVACDVPFMSLKKLDSEPARMGFQIFPGVGKSTIGAGRTDHFQCPVSADKNLEVLDSRVDIQVSYKTLGWDRTYRAHFKWFSAATPPRWIEINEKSGTDVPNMLPPFPRKQ